MGAEFSERDSEETVILVCEGWRYFKARELSVTFGSHGNAAFLEGVCDRIGRHMALPFNLASINKAGPASSRGDAVEASVQNAPNFDSSASQCGWGR